MDQLYMDFRNTKKIEIETDQVPKTVVAFYKYIFW